MTLSDGIQTGSPLPPDWKTGNEPFENSTSNLSEGGLKINFQESRSHEGGDVYVRGWR